jgi:hypothetical protein
MRRGVQAVRPSSSERYKTFVYQDPLSALDSGILFFRLPDLYVQETYKISGSSAELHCSNAPVIARKHMKWGSNFDVRAVLY